MWEESRDNFESKEFAGVLKRYKQMLTEQRTEFFDVADFEFIADQYIDKSQFSNALQACEIALRQHPNSIIVKIKKAQIFLFKINIQQECGQLEDCQPGGSGRTKLETGLLKNAGQIDLRIAQKVFSPFGSFDEVFAGEM